jgi:ornithine cyclodeaminase/alanine dehydrogenase-like protein (mu-crystallin family)
MPGRRAFLIGSGLTAAMSRSAVGAGDKIRLGVIGVGTRGSYMAGVFAAHADCEVAAVCDVFQPTVEKVAAGLASKPTAYGDCRARPLARAHDRRSRPGR